MSDDLVKRLRDMSNYYNSGGRFVAADRIEELEAKLAKAMQVIEMIASADVDAVLGEAVDISCEIIGELMEEETEDGRVFHPNQVRSSRVLDAEKLDALLAELIDTLAELKGQDDER